MQAERTSRAPTLVDRYMAEPVMIGGMIATRAAWVRAMEADGESARSIDLQVHGYSWSVDVLEDPDGFAEFRDLGAGVGVAVLDDEGAVFLLDPVRERTLFGQTVPDGAAFPVAA